MEVIQSFSTTFNIKGGKVTKRKGFNLFQYAQNLTK